MKNKLLSFLHQIPVELQTIHLADEIGQLFGEVDFEADVVLEDDAGSQLAIDDL